MKEVQIGKRKFKLDTLSSLDLKKLQELQKEKKLDDYDYAYTFMLWAINKFNEETKLTLDEFMEIFPLKDADKKFVEIGEIIGVDFKTGIGKSKDGKIQ